MSKANRQLASVKSAIERELKLSVAAGFKLPPLKGARLPAKLLTSVYFDTPDLRLARARITLRHRTQGRKSAWQLKLPLDCGRREVEMPGTSSAPPPQILDLLFLHLQNGTVQPVATLRTRRTGVRVGGSRGADVVLDEVAIRRGPARGRARGGGTSPSGPAARTASAARPRAPTPRSPRAARRRRG